MPKTEFNSTNQLEALDSANDEDFKTGIKAYLKRMFKKQLKDNLLLAFTVLAVILGVVVGVLVRTYATDLTPPQKLYFGFLGELFLRMLKFLIIPLISSSIIAGIANLGSANKTGRVAAVALVYYISTTVLAAILGIILVISIQPGSRVSNVVGNGTSTNSADPLNGSKISPVDTILDLVRYQKGQKCTF
jgi:solute carrier family 1 (high affinity glutamate transporter) protein 1